MLICVIPILILFINVQDCVTLTRGIKYNFKLTICYLIKIKYPNTKLDVQM